MKCEKLEADKKTVNGNKREKNARMVKKERKKEAGGSFVFVQCLMLLLPVIVSKCGEHLFSLPVSASALTEKEEEKELLLLHNHILITSGKLRQHTLFQGQHQG